MDYKTKPHIRTILTIIGISIIGLVGFIVSFLINYFVIKIISIIVSVLLLIASLFKLFIEIKSSIAIVYLPDSDLFEVKTLFSKKSIDPSLITRIEKTMTEYIFYTSEKKVFASCDVDVKNIDNIISYFNEKEIKVVVTQ